MNLEEFLDNIERLGRIATVGGEDVPKFLISPREEQIGFVHDTTREMIWRMRSGKDCYGPVCPAFLIAAFLVRGESEFFEKFDFMEQKGIYLDKMRKTGSQEPDVCSLDYLGGVFNAMASEHHWARHKLPKPSNVQKEQVDTILNKSSIPKEGRGYVYGELSPVERLELLKDAYGFIVAPLLGIPARIRTKKEKP